MIKTSCTEDKRRETERTQCALIIQHTCINTFLSRNNFLLWWLRIILNEENRKRQNLPRKPSLIGASALCISHPHTHIHTHRTYVLLLSITKTSR